MPRGFTGGVGFKGLVLGSQTTMDDRPETVLGQIGR